MMALSKISHRENPVTISQTLQAAIGIWLSPSDNILLPKKIRLFQPSRRFPIYLAPTSGLLNILLYSTLVKNNSRKPIQAGDSKITALKTVPFSSETWS